MKLGIMQPYFFPYIGYFQLINAVDQWVVFDTSQYIRHGWVNRNRILHPQVGPKYMLLPLAKHSKNAAINEVNLHPDLEWKSKIKAQLTDYYGRRSPHFHEVMEMVDSALDENETSLTRLLVRCLAKTCEFVGLNFDPVIASELGLDTDRVGHAGQWALEIAKTLGASEYVNPIGGREIFKPEEFIEDNILLSFLEPNMEAYDQRSGEFFEALSVLDVLMWNSKAETRLMLNDYTLNVYQLS